MLPVYKCSHCGAIFVEWTVGNEHGTPWYFIHKALHGEFSSSIRAQLICPACGTDNGRVLWFSGGPLALLNHGVIAKILSVTDLTTDEAMSVEAVVRRVKETYPGERVVTFSDKEPVPEEEGEEG